MHSERMSSLPAAPSWQPSDNLLDGLGFLADDPSLGAKCALQVGTQSSLRLAVPPSGCPRLACTVQAAQQALRGIPTSGPAWEMYYGKLSKVHHARACTFARILKLDCNRLDA